MNNPNQEKIDSLKKELSELRQSNSESWNMYGSELCVGEMISKEKMLEDEIKFLEKNDETFGGFRN